MPVVEKTGGPRVHVRGIGTFQAGDQADVSTADAQYLIEERGDFEIVDNGGEDGTNDADTVVPFDPNDLTVDELKDRLDDNEYAEDELDALYSAEAGGFGVDHPEGKERQTALDAIEARREA